MGGRQRWHGQPTVRCAKEAALTCERHVRAAPPRVICNRACSKAPGRLRAPTQASLTQQAQRDKGQQREDGHADGGLAHHVQAAAGQGPPVGGGGSLLERAMRQALRPSGRRSQLAHAATACCPEHLRRRAKQPEYSKRARQGKACGCPGAAQPNALIWLGKANPQPGAVLEGAAQRAHR